MMTGLERSEPFHGVQHFDPLALRETDDTNLEAFGTFWIDEDEKQADDADHPKLERSDDDIMPDWMCQAFPQVNINIDEDTAIFELALHGPSSVSSSPSTPGDVAGFSDHELKTLSVKDLNLMVKSKGLTREEVQLVKQRRRTIKNRGYAQDCRKKRIKVRETLETSNSELGQDMTRAREEIETLKRERDLYKSSWVALVQKINEAGLNDLIFGAV